ncbi:MAG TPA: hypothetical protein VGJ08_15370 [Rhizomicrobium sp.]|jgi:hypothetical protein
MKRLTALLSLCCVLAGCATKPAAPPRVALPPAPPSGEPVGTTGLREADLRATFGTPALVRHDGNAQIWRFDAPSCKAFFFLYSRDGATAVWHVETAPRGATIAADEACLNVLRARVAPRPVS